MESFCGEWWQFLHEYAVFDDMDIKVVDFKEIETCLNLLVMHYDRIQSELLLLQSQSSENMQGDPNEINRSQLKSPDGSTMASSNINTPFSA